MAPNRCRHPELSSLGFSPRSLTSFLLFGNRLTGPIVSANANAVAGLTPACFIKQTAVARRSASWIFVQADYYSGCAGKVSE
jgi:hypothetical protein